MAFNHISFNRNTPHGAKLRSMLDTNERADDELADMRNVMVQMLDGDGSQDIHYSEIAKRFGVADYDQTQGTPDPAQLAKAKELFLEVDTVYGKSSGDGTVNNVRASRDQLFNKLRG